MKLTPRARSALLLARAAHALPLTLTACANVLGIDVFNQQTTLHNHPDSGVDAEGDSGAGIVVAPPREAVFDHYTSQRGEIESITDNGLLENDRGEGTLAVRPGEIATERAGTVTLRADGSFDYEPPNGRFWGDDHFEYELTDATEGTSRGRVRFSVLPDSVQVEDLAAGVGNGFTISSSGDDSGVGRTVAGAGDVNGDGLDDIIVQGYAGSNQSAYVVFGERIASGTAGPAGVLVSDLDVVTTRGFRISSAGQIESVAGAGDVNGDGLADVVIGVPDVYGLTSGAAYIVFGKAEGSPVSLADLRGGKGLRLTANNLDGNQAGFSVAGAGDVNGDGLDDVVVAAPAANLGGEVYVVFGSRNEASQVEDAEFSGPTLGLGTLEDDARGFIIRGVADEELFDTAAATVAGAGDVDGDGLADVIISITRERVGVRSGRVHVVFGKRDVSDVDLANLTRGFEIRGASPAELFSDWPMVAGAGDVNADGLSDVLVAAPSSPRAYVVFGRGGSDAVVLTDIGSARAAGFVISVDVFPNLVGISVAGAGDVDGDGQDDVIVGGWRGDGGSSGRAVVVFGRASAAPIAFSTITGQSGFELNALDQTVLTNNRVARAGDVNGDGLADLLVSSTAGVHVLLGWDARNTLTERDGVLLGRPADDSLDYDGTPRVMIRGGKGTDTLVLPTRSTTLDLRTNALPVESIETIDLRQGDHTLLLNDAALRRLPDSRPQLFNQVAKTLVVLADPGDHVQLDAMGYAKKGGDGDREGYSKDGNVFYGLEISRGVTLVLPTK